MHAHGRPAIDGDRLARDRISQFGAQERYQMCDFLGLDESSDRHLLGHVIDHFLEWNLTRVGFAFEKGHEQVGSGEIGMNRVDPDTVSNDLR